MSAEVRWNVPLEIAALAALEGELDRFLSDHAVERRAAYVSRLVVEEIVRNLIEHTSPIAVADTASVTLAVTPENVTVVIEDERQPFDPFDAPGFDVGSPLEARRAGGMGLHLVRELTDRLDYERDGSHNRLTAVISRG